MPQFRVYNESSDTLFLSNLFLSLNAHFAINGIIQIEINSRIISMAGKAGDLRLKQTQSIQIINQTLAPYEYLNVYCWNGNNDDLITGTFSVATSRERFSADASDQARREVDLQAEVSETPGISQEGQALLNQISGVEAAIQNQTLNVEDLTVDNQTVVDAIEALQANLPSSPDNTGVEMALQSILDGLPASPDNSDIIQALTDVRNALPDSPNNADVITAIEALQSAVESQVVNLNDTAIVAGLQAVQDNLPSNSGVEQALADILAGLPDSPNNADVITALTAIQNALPASPDNQQTHDDLEAIITAINNQEIDIDTTDLETAINALSLTTVDNLGIFALLTNMEINMSWTQAQQDAIARIYAAVRQLADGFDLNELDNTIAVLQDDITILEPVISAELLEQFRLLLFNLTQTTETIPNLQVNARGTLLGFRAYQNEIHSAILDTKGRKNIIFDMAAASTFQPTQTRTPAPFTARIAHEDSTPQLTNWATWFFPYALNDLQRTFIILNYSGLELVGTEHALAYEIYSSPNDLFLPNNRTLISQDDNFIGNYGSINNLVSSFSFSLAPDNTDQYIGIAFDFIRHGSAQSAQFTDSSIGRINNLPFRRTRGNSRIDLQILDSFGAWKNFITAEQMGTINNALDSKIITVKEQDGNIWPSSQSLLRALLSTEGNIETGISIILI